MCGMHGGHGCGGHGCGGHGCGGHGCGVTGMQTRLYAESTSFTKFSTFIMAKLQNDGSCMIICATFVIGMFIPPHGKLTVGIGISGHGIPGHGIPGHGILNDGSDMSG